MNEENRGQAGYYETDEFGDVKIIRYEQRDDEDKSTLLILDTRIACEA